MATVHSTEERETTRFTAKVQDEAGAALPASSLDTLTLTLYDQDTGTILNSRDGQNVLNANGVTIDSSGNLTWIMTPADNAIVTASKDGEMHVALFQWTYAGGTKTGRHEVRFFVRNLAKVS